MVIFVAQNQNICSDNRPMLIFPCPFKNTVDIGRASTSPSTANQAARREVHQYMYQRTGMTEAFQTGDYCMAKTFAYVA